MRNLRRALLGLLVLLSCALSVRAQEVIRFASLDDNGSGAAPTVLDGYLFRPAGEGPFPAVVGLHGCSGMFGVNGIFPVYRQWGAELARRGYVFLLVDSFRPRNHGETCSIQNFDLGIYRKRPLDAYGGLAYLRAQPFVRRDRIALAGWSQGGGVTLTTIGRPSIAPLPGSLGAGFQAAVAFYPGACSDQRQPSGWINSVPLLVLTGAQDVWTPLAPCQSFLEGAKGRGGNIDLQVYPDAYHAFDAPNLARRELPNYRTRAGVVPIVASDPAARADALTRVPEFLARYLGP